MIFQSTAQAATAIAVVGIPGVPGSMTAPTGTGFVHITSGAIDSVARAVNLASNGAGGDVSGVLAVTNGGTGLSTLGSAFQVLQVNAGGTALQYGSVPLAQIVAPTGTGPALVTAGVWSATTGPINLAGGATWVTGTLPLANIAVGGSDYFMIMNSTGTAATWTSVSGDVSILGYGTLTVGKINGASVPAAGTLTTGNVLQVTGASALGYGAVNLAGGAGYITGVLPIGSLGFGTNAQYLVTNAGGTAAAWVTLSGDATSTAAGVHTVTQAQAGAIAFTVTTGATVWAATATPSLSQTSEAGAATPSNFTITPQLSTNVAGTTGHLIVNLQPPTVAAGYASTGRFKTQTNGVTTFCVGTDTYWGNALFFADPSSTNAVIYQIGSSTLLNGTGSVGIELNGSASVFRATLATTEGVIGSGYNFALSSTVAGAYGGGLGVMGLQKAGTNPTTSISTGGVIYSDASTGALCLYAPTDTSTTGPSMAVGHSTWTGGVGQALTIGIAGGAQATAFALSITGQATSSAAGTGGAVTITGGGQTSGAGTAGAANLIGGSTTTGTGGGVIISSGTGNSTSGNVTIGTGSNGTPGSISLSPNATTMLQLGNLGSGVGVLYFATGTIPSGNPVTGMYLCCSAGTNLIIKDTGGREWSVGYQGIYITGAIASDAYTFCGGSVASGTGASANFVAGASASGAGGAVSLTSGQGTSANGALTISSGTNTVYSSGAYSSGDTPGTWTWNGPGLTTEAYATFVSNAAALWMLPVTINGVSHKVLCL
jgi:hypothetical protein